MARGDTGKTLGMAPSRFNDGLGGGRPAGAHNYNHGAASRYGWNKGWSWTTKPRVITLGFVIGPAVSTPYWL